LKRKLSLLIALAALFVTLPVWAEDEEVVHNVKKGDTLWDISNMYLKTPWKWPLIWANNQDITNPHLIYPGDTIIISRKEGEIQVTVIPEEKPLETPPEVKVYTLEQIAEQKEKTIVVSPNFSCLLFSPTLMTGKGTVVMKEDIGILGSLEDTILIKMPSETKADGFAIVTKVDEVKKGTTTIGYLYKVVALAKVRESQSGIVKAKVTYANQEIKEGDIVTTDLTSLKPITLTLNQPKTDGVGQILKFYPGISGSGNMDLIIVDIGSSQGIQKGSLLTIYQTFNLKDGGAVEEYQGLALVLQSLEGSALALVVDARGLLEKGYKVSGK
jgi:LysM domain